MTNPTQDLKKEIETIHRKLRQIGCELRDMNFRLDYLIDQLRGNL